jgi:drug/metabolite transporter (DMT)-like permease
MSAGATIAWRPPRARVAIRAAGWRLEFVALAAIWGSSFLMIKVLGRHWAPLDVALGRVALGALTLVAVLAVRGERLPRGRDVWGRAAIVGLLMNALPFTLFAVGEEHVSSVLAGLWNATTPLMTLVAVVAFLPDERPDRRKLAGLALGFAGVACVLGPWRGLGGQALVGQLTCAAAAVCYGLGITFTRRALGGRAESGLALACAQLLCATAMLAAIAPLAGAPTASLPVDALASLLILGVLGSGVAYALTNRIVRAAGPTTFSTVTYVIPLFSTALGVALLGESFSWNELLGAAIVLAAMAWSAGGRDRAGGRTSRRMTPVGSSGQPRRPGSSRSSPGRARSPSGS